MDILPQTAEQIKSDWDYFSKAINAMSRKTGGEITPEQVFEAAKDGRVMVFNVMDEAKIGLLVLSDYEDGYTGKQVLHVDILYMTGGQVLDMSDLLTQMAQKYDFDRIEFTSTRPGWFKYLEAAGYAAAVKFSKEMV